MSKTEHATTDAVATVNVLAFHKIGEPPAHGWQTWNYVPEDVFVGYLEHLERAGYDVLDVERFLQAAHDPGVLSERSVLLTFDDGYESMLTVAEPLLARFGFPSVLFVPTDYVAGTNRFDHGAEPEERLCDWEQLAELARRGVAIESHGVTHRTFSDLTTPELDGELRGSKEAIESHLDAPVRLFAYPFGDAGTLGDGLGPLVRDAGYAGAFLYKGGGLAIPAGDRFRMPRIPMGPDTALSDVLTGEDR